MAAAEKLFGELTALGVETVLDDRDERPGVKFKDADLVGYPLRLTVSEKSLAEGKAELKGRQAREATMTPLGEAAALVAALRDQALKAARAA
jgi:prolyl-tRNA synthetase